MKDRRGSRRRSIPFVRSAVLEVNQRNHIVVVTDLSPESAFLSTRITVTQEDSLRLRMVIPRDGREVAIACQLARRQGEVDPVAGQPPGIAVRFSGLDAASIRRVEEFSMEGFLPALEPTPRDHYEYRVLERTELSVEDLNHLGLDGWRLAATLPSPSGPRLVFVRRL